MKDLRQDKTLGLQYKNAKIKQEEIAQLVFDCQPTKSLTLLEIRREVDVFLTDTMSKNPPYRTQKLNDYIRDLVANGAEGKIYKRIRMK